MCICFATQADASDGSMSGCAALFVCRNSWVQHAYTSRNAPMILTVTPSGEGHPAHHFLWSKYQGSTTPSSYGKTFKMSEPHRWSRFTYQFEMYSSAVNVQYLLRLPSPWLRRLSIAISSPDQSSYAWGVTRCLHNLSAPVRGRRLGTSRSGFSAVSRRCKSLVVASVCFGSPWLGKDLTRAFLSLLSLFEFFETIVFCT